MQTRRTRAHSAATNQRCSVPVLLKLPLCTPGQALIVAPWPAAGAVVDAHALGQFGALQAAVRAIRNARAEYGVELGRKIAATVVVRGDEALRCAVCLSKCTGLASSH